MCGRAKGVKKGIAEATSAGKQPVLAIYSSSTRQGIISGPKLELGCVAIEGGECEGGEGANRMWRRQNEIPVYFVEDCVE